MITINPRIEGPSEELLQRYKEIEPATVGHLLEFGFCDPEIRPLWTPCSVVGPAFTVRTSALDSTIVHVAIDMAEPGDVLLIDRSGDRRHACWGGMTTLAAKKRGLAGVVIDGCVTDLLEIQEFQFPVYGRSISALTTKGLALEGEINTPIQIGGAPVHPGDLVVADSDGIVVIPPVVAAQIVDRAEEGEARSSWIREELESGTKISELSGAAARIRARMDKQ
jgi:regulator of RNase E activity RraA